MMVFKRLFFIVSISLSCQNVFSQFHIDQGLNLNFPQRSSDLTTQSSAGEIFGIGIFFEPKYSLNEKVDLGLRISYNYIIGLGPFNNKLFFWYTRLIPVLATGTFKITSNKQVPYFGIACGIYRKISGASNKDDYLKPGFALRTGMQNVKNIDLGLSYHFVDKVDFLQINLGFRIHSRD